MHGKFGLLSPEKASSYPIFCGCFFSCVQYFCDSLIHWTLTWTTILNVCTWSFFCVRKPLGYYYSTFLQSVIFLSASSPKEETKPLGYCYSSFVQCIIFFSASSLKMGNNLWYTILLHSYSALCISLHHSFKGWQPLGYYHSSLQCIIFLSASSLNWETTPAILLFYILTVQYLSLCVIG